MHENDVCCRPEPLLVLAAIALSACSGSENVGPGADSGTDTDTDTDSDSDTESECDAGVDEAYQWHTFYGQSGVDRSEALVVDASGAVYITGASDGPWTGPAGEPPLHAFSGEEGDAFVLKLDVDGVYQWHTFISVGYADIALDESGNLVVVGASASTWNGPDGEDPLHMHSGGDLDLCVLKLNSEGIYQWHTFYGSQYGSTIGMSLGVDTGGNIYVTGDSDEEWYGPGGESPLHEHYEIQPYDPIDDHINDDLVVLKLDSNGAYQWHTFYGANRRQVPLSIAVDGTGNTYLTAISQSSWNGPGGESPLEAPAGEVNSVVLKLGPSGDYQWHTFYGSENIVGYVEAVAIDGSGDLYLTGTSPSSWNGPGGDPPLHSLPVGEGGLLVLKLDADGNYQWHTLYESSGGLSVAVANSGDLLVTGAASESWTGPNGECPVHAFTDGPIDSSIDALVLALDSEGTYLWHSFYGATGEGYVSGFDVASGISKIVYVTGRSDISWNGGGDAPPLHTYSGDQDFFVLKLAP